MKTNIEIFDINETRNGIKVDFCLYDEAGQANISQTIPYDSLENYIVFNDLNIEQFTNWKHVSLECDGLDERTIPADEYLSENLSKVVLGYLEFNLTEAA